MVITFSWWIIRHNGGFFSKQKATKRLREKLDREGEKLQSVVVVVVGGVNSWSLDIYIW